MAVHNKTSYPPLGHQHTSCEEAKSRSIKIKQPSKEKTSPTSYEDDEQAQLERMYDWATWRMYHRITSFRQSRYSATMLSPLPGEPPLAPSSSISRPNRRLSSTRPLEDYTTAAQDVSRIQLISTPTNDPSSIDQEEMFTLDL